jgi:hypothetical protein
MGIVFLYRIDIVNSQRSAVADTVVEYLESISIIPVQPVIRAKPHKAIVILANADNCVVGQPLLYTETSDGYRIGEKGTAISNKKKATIYVGCKFKKLIANAFRHFEFFFGLTPCTIQKYVLGLHHQQGIQSPLRITPRRTQSPRTTFLSNLHSSINPLQSPLYQ